jgi:hypothetical protein
MLVQLGASRAAAALAAILVLFTAFPGCSRFGVRNHPRTGQAAAEPMSFTVDVFQNRGARTRNSVREDGLVTSLLFEKNGRWQVVARSARGHWSLRGLVPGKYRLHVAGVLNEAGELESIRGPRAREFQLREGAAAYADVVVKRTPTAVKVIIALTIVVVVILAILAILDGDGDVDLDVADVVAPIAAIPRLIITYPEIWLVLVENLPSAPPPPYAFDQAGEDRVDAPEAPQITRYAPRHEATGVRGDADIRITFDRPMSAWTLSPNTLYVEGTKSGEVVRGVDYLEAERTAVIDPLRDYLPGEVVTVTIYGESIASADGEVLQTNYRFSFEIEPEPESPAGAAGSGTRR